MKKALLMLVCLLLMLMPCAALAEEADALPEGYRVEDFGDFTMPVPPNAMVERYYNVPHGYIAAEITYIDMEEPAFQPYMIIWWYDNNLSAYYRHVRPLEYGKMLTKQYVEDLREDGVTVTDAKTVYGSKQGDAIYTIHSMHLAENSFYADGPHDLWIYQRFYGTYDMGTYFFEIYAPTRAHVDAIVQDVERIVYAK